MISLSATAIEGQALVAVGISQGHQFGRNFCNCGIPGNSFEVTIGGSSQRLIQSVGMVLVVIQLRRLLAHIPGADRITFVRRPFSVCTLRPQLREHRMQAVGCQFVICQKPPGGYFDIPFVRMQAK